MKTIEVGAGVSIVSAEDFICTVEYDYPNFHLTMHCFYCTVIGGELKFLEHEAAKWLGEKNSLGRLATCGYCSRGSKGEAMG